jgi:hypothetical protein
MGGAHGAKGTDVSYPNFCARYGNTITFPCHLNGMRQRAREHDEVVAASVGHDRLL